MASSDWRVSSQEGRRSLHFADGSSVSADFVIGAEGAASRTRSLVTPQQPSYAGGAFLEMEITQPSSQLSKTVGRGSMYALGEHTLVLLRAFVSLSSSCKLRLNTTVVIVWLSPHHLRHEVSALVHG